MLGENFSKGKSKKEYKTFKKIVSDDIRNLKTVLESFNKITLDYTETLKNLAYYIERELGEENDYWHPVFGPDGEVPGDEHSWVLVKIKDIGPAGGIYNVPRIAEYRKDGLWWALDLNKPYGVDEELPFEVAYWRPIPGDTAYTIYSNNEEIGRHHRYE